MFSDDKYEDIDLSNLNYIRPVFKDVKNVDNEYKEDHDHRFDIEEQLKNEREDDNITGDDVIEYPVTENEMTPDEIIRRDNEFKNLSKKGKNLFNEIIGKRNTRLLQLDVLVENSIDMINKSDDDIDEIDFSPEFLEFLNWFSEQRSNQNLYKIYYEQEEIFEDILNDKLDNEDENSLFDIMTKQELSKSGIIEGTDKPMSALEEESIERFEILSTSEINLIDLFINIKKYKNYTWDKFKSILINNN